MILSISLCHVIFILCRIGLSGLTYFFGKRNSQSDKNKYKGAKKAAKLLLSAKTSPKLFFYLHKAAELASMAYCYNQMEEIGPGIYSLTQILPNYSGDLEVWVSLSGIEFPKESWLNRKYDMRTPPDNTNIQVDMTFYNQFAIIRNTLVKGIAKKVDHHLTMYGGTLKKINIIGHSVGGAYALFTGAFMAQTFEYLKFQVFTFGQPNLGDFQFASMVETLKAFNLEYHRITHTNDYVPRLPGGLYSFAWVHPRPEIWISIDCDCPEESEKVYICFALIKPGSNQGRNCNGLTDNYEIGDAAHNGPYFGHRMGYCPS
ncbi:hypothetical protein G9A89_007884 [Geosiphon pyriformis]|nr:hypothetical protein G9A89_007884 [Geosiphon pyriformis]